MSRYIRKVNYYETDKMGITHHSNYIRFMEEARMSFLDGVGYPLKRLENEGIMSPVVSVSCDYKRPTTYGDEILIEVSAKEYSGVKLILSYIMTNTASGDTVAVASSTHCFIDQNGRPIALKKKAPELDEIFNSYIGK